MSHQVGHMPPQSHASSVMNAAPPTRTFLYQKLAFTSSDSVSLIFSMKPSTVTGAYPDLPIFSYIYNQS